MHGVILAAGQGRRLKDKTPKVLLQVNQERLIERHIHLFNRLGVNEFTTVIGYGGVWTLENMDKIRKIVEKYGGRTVVNMDSQETHSTWSLGLGLKGLTEDVLVVDGDLYYEYSLSEYISDLEETTLLGITGKFSSGTFLVIENESIVEIGESVNTGNKYSGIMFIKGTDLPCFTELATQVEYKNQILGVFLNDFIHIAQVGYSLIPYIPEKPPLVNINTLEDIKLLERLRS